MSHSFVLSWNRGGLTGLKAGGDVFDTDYLWPGETLGDVVIRYRYADEDWRAVTAFASGDIRSVDTHDDGVWVFHYAGTGQLPRGIRDFTLTVTFALQDDGLTWTLRFHNSGDRPLELGDIALPLPFNRQFVQDNLANYTRVVARHSFMGGHGAFIFWERPNGVGPYLVMTPLPGTKLEYYEEYDMQDRSRIACAPYWVYIHSAVNGAGETRGTWRQPHTNVTLAPAEDLTYGFKFRWAEDYAGVRDVLYEEGGFDVHVIPGMTVPVELPARFALRTKQREHTIIPEYPTQTQVTYLGELQSDTHVYEVVFGRLGENLLTVQYGEGWVMPLEFFVTEPLETLIAKRTRFLVHKQQHRDANKWYDGLFSVWDMRHAVLRGPDDTDGFDGWWGYVLACDDTALPKAPFIAAKNVHYPVQEEIAAVEYYLEHFVWGKLQRTDTEDPYPYFIYGVPNWYENRHHEHSFGSQGRGLEHIWRGYDYPHIIMLYFHMYQIASLYPGMTHYLDKMGYLARAFGTARAHFTLGGSDDLPQGAQGYWAYTLGLYNELLIIDLITALETEGWHEQAVWLRGEWEKKVKYFVYDDPYPFDSEYPFDTTAFETSHAVAKYGLEHNLEPDENLWYDKYKDKWYSHPEVKRADFEAFMEKQLQANIALRGWVEPAYYLLGGDYRGGQSSAYALSYMSQLGGWAIVDYALYYAQDPALYLRLGYASTLSSWALMNTGTPESNYGYWYPGSENDGASGWAITPEKYGPMWIRKHNGRGAWFYDGEIELGYAGALRTAATVVVDDPLFGRTVYGGLPTAAGIVPQDGVRQRFHIIRDVRRLHILLGRDGFTAHTPIFVDEDLKMFQFTLENRTLDAHNTTLQIAGLMDGEYAVTFDGQPLESISSVGGEWVMLNLHIPASAHCTVVIQLV
ncbi:MAG: hypothetical protein JXA33_19360 [Anaerolineae bacterium]|nr:hypothetical protein [Anaerolineae bacterium]